MQGWLHFGVDLRPDECALSCLSSVTHLIILEGGFIPHDRAPEQQNKLFAVLNFEAIIRNGLLRVGAMLSIINNHNWFAEAYINKDSHLWCSRCSLEQISGSQARTLWFSVVGLLLFPPLQLLSFHRHLSCRFTGKHILKKIKIK